MKYFVIIVIIMQLVTGDAQCEYKQVMLNSDYNCPSSDYVIVLQRKL